LYTTHIVSFARMAGGGAVIKQGLLGGMGGSSLGAQTLARAGGSGLPLVVLDSTHPGHISKVCKSIDWAHTLVVVSSKSGTTVETRAHLEHVWSLSGRADRFVVVTDPGTELAALAGERGFLRIFENPPDIGGRFSALSYFGLVPAALAGADIRPVLHGARRAMAADSPGVTPGSAPGVRLGAAMAVAQSKEDRDKLTLVLPRRLESLGPWIEQLVAESVGKEGTGVLPVVGESLGSPETYGTDRFFCAYTDGGKVTSELGELEAEHPMVVLTDTWGVGAEMFRWEMAAAVLGYLLDVNPFDQPDVEAAKDAARRALEEEPGEVDVRPAEDLLERVRPGDYVAILAYVDPDSAVVAALEDVRVAIRDRTAAAVTLGIGPRYLHSTGQLHKGGPDTGFFLQIVVPDDEDLPVPGEDFTFGALKRAQAAGDLAALREGKRRAARVELDDLLAQR
jgi:transaldolase / glucose-6-phosphate isomerase